MSRLLKLSKCSLVILTLGLGMLFRSSPASQLQPRGITPTRAEIIPIPLGIIAPLSGPFSIWGRSILDGALLAAELSEHKFEIIFEDSACDPSKTITAIQKLLTFHDINLVIGPGCATGFRPAASAARKHNALLFSPGLLDDNIFSEYNNMINLATQISTEMRYLAEHIASKKVKNLAIVHGTNFFGEEQGKTLPQFLTQAGVQVPLIERTHLEEQDYKALIGRLLRHSPDGVYIHQGEAGTGIFVRQLRELGFKGKIFSYYGLENDTSLEFSHGALEGIEYTFPLRQRDSSSTAKRISNQFQERFKKSPNATALFVIDGILALDRALTVCSANDIKCVKTSMIESNRLLKGSRSWKIDKLGRSFRPFGIKIVKNGRFHWAARTK